MEIGELVDPAADITGATRGFDGGVKRASLTPTPLRPMTNQTNTQFKRLVPTSPAGWEDVF
jgi:hypothetical protein